MAGNKKYPPLDETCTPKYLKDFQYIMAVEYYGGITQAADALHIAQPALSRHIKRIEDELGIALFDRTTLPIRLTSAGEQYIDTGRQMSALASHLSNRLEEIKNTGNSRLRVGISPSRTAYLLPDILARFRTGEYCNTAVDIVEKGINELDEMLNDGRLDLIFSYRREESANYCLTELFEEKMYIALPKKCNHEYNDNVMKAFRENTVIVLPPDTRTGAMTRNILNAYDIEPKDVFNCVMLESAMAMVRAGLGVTVVPSFIAFSGLTEDIILVELDMKAIPEARSEDFCLISRKRHYLTGAEKHFIECTKTSIDEKWKETK